MFVTAFLGYTLAKRLRATEALAEKRGVDLANLAQINEIIIQRLQSGILVCDATGRIRRFNQPAQKFFGLPPDPGSVTLSEVAPDLAIQFFQWLNSDPAGRLRQIFRSRRNFTLLPRFVTLGEGQNDGVLIFLDDMSILKQQAQQLKMAALARLTASIAHEIRNPLGALSNAAQLLGETVTENDQEKRLIQIIDEQSRRMNVIVENVTQLSRRDRTNPARLDLDEWIREFIRQYTGTVFIPSETFSLQSRQNLGVVFDPEQLYQVVSNLCQNALRASPQFTGTPLVRFAMGQDSERRPYLDVIDWGKGVPSEIVDNIFDPFFTTTPKGTGLGLYIARELCEGNGGALEYRPGEGGVGSVFRVVFAQTDERP
jgi:two-component system sensor histidine kinase PilS (NtrC family)